MQILYYLFSLVTLVCFIILVIAAFKSAVWKGILGFFCFIYLLYFAFVEFEHEKKMMIALGYLVGVVGATITGMASGMAAMPGAGS